ncbi:hypothetical protein [Aeromonas hydrophila]|uniref:hypothetical protein n=1 Tax=Aeromonas hydrophila TaxID=644 RepID=UPI003F7A3635
MRSRLLIPLPLQEDQAGALIIHSDQQRLFSQEEEQLFIQLTDYLAYGLQARHTQQAICARNRRRSSMPASWSWHWKMRWVPSPPCWSSAIPIPLAIRNMSPGWRRPSAGSSGWKRSSCGDLSGRHGARYRQDPGAGRDLTKPERLTPLEFELVKEHPAIGYLVLKDIDFPGPSPG